MVCTRECAIHRLYTGGCYISFVHHHLYIVYLYICIFVQGRMLYIVCTRRVLYIVCTREGAMYRLHMGDCDILFAHGIVCTPKGAIYRLHAEGTIYCLHTGG